ncbi:diaminopimelate decarboxylase [Desulfosporosinus acidiphilus SJ4]|uniref:Diaminopimelate decarboxylase n=1 Tax=Desulfosporosinus acidiphilus (strain DSM 22704 / JCM 16185 / SJ4) TaxID=646529 RepID=I4D8R9_DESAJ|nr:diaminopimelate decarboxylase [Desulfosporosinus acidiphilus]AFM42193.1 diaminopimelate decarboxylase [Desulfosporosinus acidiphilus SJ4]
MRLHGTQRINEQGHLEIGGCDTVNLAQEFGTPLYIMDEAHIREICRRYYQSFTQGLKNAEVIYASKAFSTMAMCRIINQEGLGLDVVSGGELYTALQADFPAERIYFHGNNKSAEELAMALKAGVGRIVVDNFYEMSLLNDLAQGMNQKANILLRVTPGIEAHTHEYIQTGQIDSKFGFTLSNGTADRALDLALSSANLVVKGVHAHIGSQIFELESFSHEVRVMIQYMADIYERTGSLLEELNLGGGFGIYYASGDEPAQIEDYAKIVRNALEDACEKHKFPIPKIIIEPGRSIVGTAGTTLYTIGSIKEIPGIRKYIAVDGGMADNPRPALYQARYEAVLANRAAEENAEEVSITGKCCESGDMLIWDINLPKVQSGDLLAVSCTGAYNYSMSSNYNRLPRPAAIFAEGGKADVIVKRENYSDLLRNDVLPERLAHLPMASR